MSFTLDYTDTDIAQVEVEVIATISTARHPRA